MRVGTRGMRARGATALVVLALAAGTWSCSASRAFQRRQQRRDATRLGPRGHLLRGGRQVGAGPRRLQDGARSRAAGGRAGAFREGPRVRAARSARPGAARVPGASSNSSPASQEARAGIQRLEQTIRDRIEAARPKPAAEVMRQQARKQMEEPALNPASREPVVLKFQNRQMKEILDFLGELHRHQRRVRQGFPADAAHQRQHRRRDAGGGAPADPHRERRLLQGAEPAQHHRHRRQPGQARRLRRAGGPDVLPLERRRGRDGAAAHQGGHHADHGRAPDVRGEQGRQLDHRSRHGAHAADGRAAHR